MSIADRFSPGEIPLCSPSCPELRVVLGNDCVKKPSPTGRISGIYFRSIGWALVHFLLTICSTCKLNCHMKKFPILLLLATAMQFSRADAQTQPIRGRVLDDSTGMGLPAATILIQGTNKGTASGPDGVFTIALPTDGKRHMIAGLRTGYTFPTTVPRHECQSGTGYPAEETGEGTGRCRGDRLPIGKTKGCIGFGVFRDLETVEGYTAQLRRRIACRQTRRRSGHGFRGFPERAGADQGERRRFHHPGQFPIICRGWDPDG